MAFVLSSVNALFFIMGIFSLQIPLSAALTTPSCDPNAISPLPTIFGVQILNITATAISNWQNVTANDVCHITITLTHPGTNDRVHNDYMLPLSSPWNHIFLGIGGGGFAAGAITEGAPYTPQGYAVGATDAGLPVDAPNSSQTAAAWALHSPGNVDDHLLLNFARRSLHDMTVVGKAIAAQFYGVEKVERAYWSGCSTGGRQGMMLAQYYPGDYDGILADAPAMQWNDFLIGMQWPFTAQNVEGYTVPPCEFDFVAKETVKACDALDGLVDGLISAPALCKFSAQSLVGQTYVCSDDGSTRTFAQTAANIVDSIWAGTRTPEGDLLWYGLPRGSNFSGQAPNIAGNDTAQPFAISDSWIKGFVAKDLDFDTSNVSYAELADIFLQSKLQYDSIIGTMSPDLAPFKRRGGKIITWHGLSDELIPPQGSMLYYQKVLALDPQAGDFYRQFYSPGVAHCGLDQGGTGVVPLEALAQLRAWVENGTAPDTLRAGGPYAVNASADDVVDLAVNVRFMDLCPWPAVNQYRDGDPALAESYECLNGTGWLDFAGLDATNTPIAGGPGWYGSSFPELEI